MPSPALLRWQVYHQAKSGHSADEYEDAWAANARARRFAVADAASESSYGALWADLLVQALIQTASAEWKAGQWLARLRQIWAEQVDGRPLPWYGEIKRAAGADATLLGLALTRRATYDQPGRWRALALGDACLFRIRRGRLRQPFPLTRAGDFTNHPALLNSRRPERPALRQVSGAWHAGDRFLLMTDALAQWFLQQHEQGRTPWSQLDELAEPGDFLDWIDRRRRAGQLRNDDVTLLVVNTLAQGRPSS
jgi:hypothetical protein